MATKISLALVHHPVAGRKGETIAAAVTSLDLHDIARLAKTFGVETFYVVTPLADQQQLVQRIIDHWVRGVGAEYNPDRRDALALIRLQPTLDDAVREATQDCGLPPKTVVTSARMGQSNLTFSELRLLAQRDVPLMLVFGTAWGLTQEVLDQADYRLAPIQGTGAYNHLAVRSAVAIVLDRMMADRADE